MNTEINVNSKTLGNEIKEVLIKYLDDKPWKSATGLSNAKIGKTTLNKIYNGESKTPIPRSIAGILEEINKKEISNGKTWDEIVQSYSNYPMLHATIKSYVEKHYKGTSQNKLVSDDFESCLKDENLFRAIIMSQDDYGVAKETLAKLFDYEVLRTIEHLVDKGVLNEKDGRIFSTNEIINTCQDTTHALAINLLKKCYNIEDFGTGIKNELRVEYRTNVNREYLMPLLSKRTVQYMSDIRTLLDDPKACGEDILWVMAGMDNLLKTAINSQSNKETLQ